MVSGDGNAGALVTALRSEQGLSSLTPETGQVSGHATVQGPTSQLDWVRHAIGASGDILYKWDILSDRLAWAGEIEEVLGEGEHAIASGHGFNNRIHPEDLPRRLKALSDHFSQGDNYDCEYRVRNGQGIVIWVHDRGRVEIDANGLPVAMSGAMRVITQRKQNEARLERIANSVQEKIALLPPTAKLVPVAFAREPRPADVRAKDIARVFTAIETINGADEFDEQSGWGRYIQPLDRGSFNMSAFLQTLRQLNYAGPVGLQCYGLTGDARDHLSRSIAAWRKLNQHLAENR